MRGFHCLKMRVHYGLRLLLIFCWSLGWALSGSGCGNDASENNRSSLANSSGSFNNAEASGDNQDIVQQIKDLFSGKTVDIFSNSQIGSSHYASRTRIYLCVNGTFGIEEMDVDSYQSQDYSSYGGGYNQDQGRWDFVVVGDSLLLILESSDGYYQYEVGYSQEENRFYLDGDVAYLIEQNPFCR